MPPYPLINFEIRKYYQNEPKFNGVYSRNNLSKIKEMRKFIGNRDIIINTYRINHIIQ